MPEPIKCPRCEEGELYERCVHYSYSQIVRTPEGAIDYGTPEGDESGGDVDCWTCLDCGAMLTWEEEKAIQESENG